MTDAKYFANTKRGELFELKGELNSDKKEKRREAVKKVIASMTVGKDVSSLFPDVVNCMQTDNLELKKLVYLYLMNYAKSQPDMAIMAVNTFVRDCDDPNPLIRALAVRTMGCIRVDKITEYLTEPLRKCLRDEDPYVRKTAAVCVAKLHDINASMVEEQGFLDLLRDLISDSNPMVVANAVAALTEINETSSTGQPLVDFNSQTINKFLTALNECTEWGQVFILDSLANYTPKDDREAQSICERVTPRLAHANAAVVLSAVKVLMRFMERMNDPDFVNTLAKKLAPPLVTLLSSEPEVQYVALRNINLIVQKRPDILKHEMKVFFVKYNDPIYVKLEKLDIMIRLASQANITQVLAELKEYATEVDVDFVRKAVRAIGRCAIKVEQSAERCVSTLMELIQTKVNYVVQEAIVVIKDIFRKYPNKYETIISTLCENLDTLDEPEARASMIWIVGEYAERIDNADELLENFLEGFHDENSQVQLQLLTAIVKLFLKRPETQELVQQVLSLATQDSDNPDLRDRGYIYWRLLSTDPTAAKEVVLAEKPLISEETDLLEPTLLDELICHIGSLASVYHKPPSTFVEGKSGLRRSLNPKSASGDDSIVNSNSHDQQPTVIPSQDTLIGDLLSLELNPPQMQHNYNTSGMGISNVDILGGGLDSLLGGNDVSVTPQANSNAFTLQSTSTIPPMSTSSTGLLGDIFGGIQMSSSFFAPPQQVWLPATNGKGLEITGTFTRFNRQIQMDMTFSNRAMQAMTSFAIQFNKNTFGLAPAQPLTVQSPLMPNISSEVRLPLVTTGPTMAMDPLTTLQVAIKNNVDVFYFSCIVPLHVFCTEDGSMEKRVFLATWKDIPDQNEQQFVIENVNYSADDISHKLQCNNIFTLAKNNVEGQDMLYQSCKLTNGVWVLAELKIQPGNPRFTLSIKSRATNVAPCVHQMYEMLLAN
ncbi:adaptor protein complex 1/2, beta subunit [Brevipalpus obovatus]|uniref:adaptor protein complex 1/2, beta subunit n=1 Tax=Brevipalpus obovatus TaxID=246614 RepID=UPI003D9F9098